MHSKNNITAFFLFSFLYENENVPVFRSGKSMDDGGFLYGCGLETAPAGRDSPDELFNTPLKREFDFTNQKNGLYNNRYRKTHFRLEFLAKNTFFCLSK